MCLHETELLELLRNEYQKMEKYEEAKVKYVKIY